MKSTLYVLLATAMTALCWGAYGPLLKIGEVAMAGSHWLPFLFVGIAYFLIAVVATIPLLAWLGEPGGWNFRGVLWSFFAGCVTAIGAMCLILALTNRGNPIYVMPLVFGGAPVVNTLLTMWMSKSHREASPWFYAGLIVVIAGAATVLVTKPRSVPPAPVAAASEAATEQPTQPAAPAPASASLTFPELLTVLGFVALTAICWGSYGPLLHKGQTYMQGSRMRPFICVGVAYMIIAVIAPLIIWAVRGLEGEISARGAFLSLAGGTAGALGSLGVILAFTFGGKPIYVMPLVFGCAPVVNTFISMAMTPNLSSISPLFYAGLIIVAAGAVSVLIFAPRGSPHPPAAAEPAK